MTPTTDRSRRDIVTDALCLMLIMFASAAPYVTDVGFYSDDWGLFASYQFYGFGGVFQSFPGRPIEAVESATLFSLFGWNPLGYHVVNTAIIASCGVLFYLLLWRMNLGRAESFVAAVLFLVLPQLSTVRAWIATAQVPLALLFALASLHAQLAFARFGRAWTAAGALLAAVLSVGSYEIFAPLIVALAIGLMVRRPVHRRTVLATFAVAALLLAVVLYKVWSSGRAGNVLDVRRYAEGAARLVSPAYDWRTDSSLNLFAAIEVHFWLTLEGWLDSAWRLLSGQTTPPIIFAALVTAALTYWRLRKSASHTVRSRRLIWLGLAAFLLGHATFLIVPSIMFSPTGLTNRVLVAAALGVAMIFAAALTQLRGRNPRALAPATAVVVACATLWIGRIESYWAEAPALQHRVLAAAKADLRTIPTGSTVILDGVCPYHGPAPVFETSWDVGPALSVELGREVQGDAVSSRMSLTREGLLTSMYKEPSLYRYSPNLYAYNPNLRLLAPLRSLSEARDYFLKAGRWPRPCGQSFVGHGELI